ncbi:acyl carrier protein [Streptomyces sp. HSG2]|uniref:acyl carrier protein n=1 Tax=Streptomyces sp. HSG2 TaxID=2797167 RepID=UPI0019066CBE|nr:acyl carrier protein [Streptomyces sp. HSG2]
MTTPVLELQELTKLCGDVIGVPAPGPGDNFLEAGGDSLMALRIAALLEERWGIAIEASDVLFAESFAELYTEVLGFPLGHG